MNRHLAALTEGGERGGFPLQLNLAVNGSPGAQQIQQQAAAAQRFRHQNLILTEVESTFILHLNSSLLLIY